MRTITAGLLAVLLASACASFPEPEEEERWQTPQCGMVASQHRLATEVGVAMLEAGGNAADAAVATALALAVVAPQSGNLGGGGLAVWVAHDPARAPLVLDFLETAPAAIDSVSSRDEGRGLAQPAGTGPLSVGVPGTPHGLWVFQRRVGRLPFAQVAQPAIDLARHGFDVDASLAARLALPEVRQMLSEAGMARAVFYPRGEALREGALLRQEVLAETLEVLVARGPAGFYRGDMAEAIVGALEPLGGVLSVADLQAYEPTWREPLRGWFRGLEIVTVPPPSAGGLVLLQVLAMLDGFPLDEEMESTRQSARDLDPDSPVARVGLSGRAVHWWIEAMRRGFADRAVHMGDPDFHAVPTLELLSPTWIAERRVSIGELADPRVSSLAVQAESEETTHVSVLDREGNAVSLTITLGGEFGSGLMVRGGGFLLNSAMDHFAKEPGSSGADELISGSANASEPGKRPLSSLTPAVVREGGQTVRLVLGSPGGPKIITALIQVLLRTEVYGQSLEDALAAPRLHQQWSPAATRFEDSWDPLLLQDLRNRGHDVQVSAERFGAVQAIRVEVGGVPEGISDPRGEGSVMQEDGAQGG